MRTDTLSRTPGGRSVRLFLTYVNEMPLPRWAEIVRDRRLVAGVEDAERLLRRIVRDMDHHWSVFETKNGVLDVLQRFECREGRRLSAARSVADQLRPATEAAALAVLLHSQLDAAMFATLYQPFSVDIPPTLLFGLTE